MNVYFSLRMFCFLNYYDILSIVMPCNCVQYKIIQDWQVLFIHSQLLKTYFLWQYKNLFLYWILLTVLDSIHTQLLTIYFIVTVTFVQLFLLFGRTCEPLPPCHVFGAPSTRMNPIISQGGIRRETLMLFINTRNEVTPKNGAHFSKIRLHHQWDSTQLHQYKRRRTQLCTASDVVVCLGIEIVGNMIPQFQRVQITSFSHILQLLPVLQDLPPSSVILFPT